MISNCIECGIEINYEPIENFLESNTGNLKPSICSDVCEIANRDRRQKEMGQNLFYRILKVMPDVYKGVKMSDFDKMTLKHAQSKKDSQATDIVKNFCNSYYWNITLASEGYGNGKTRFGLYTLACLALKGFYKTKDICDINDAGFFSAIDIVKILKTETFDQKQYKLKLFYNSRVLMIDDLGQENERDSSEIAGIIKVREENNRKTIITTNIGPDEMERRYTGRVYSRLQRGIFHVIGKDFRK